MSEISTKQPKQIYMLFFAEMWERFSYYGMRALLVLFMLSHFGWSDDTAYAIYATYGALVYATPFIGGVIADRVLGSRKAVLFGGIMMAIGHIVMAGPDFLTGTAGEVAFYSALAFLIIGNGFFKPNMSSLVGSLYEEGDPRRDAGFTIFYMGVNLGAFLAPLVCGTVGEIMGWSYGFGLAAVGMFGGLVVFNRGQKSLEHRGLPPSDLINQKKFGIKVEWLVYLGAIAVVPLVASLILFHDIVDIGLPFFCVAVLGFILVVAMMSKSKVERERLFVILVLVFFSTTFWAFFEQAGSSITLFTDRNVSKGFLPTTIFQSVNPMYILLLAPFFSALWTSLARKGRDFSVPVKFALGMFQLGAGFLIMVLGARMAAEDGMVGLIWLMLGYLLHTTGELCLSPVGLSMVTKLSPKKIVAMVLGAWYLSTSMAHIVGGTIASFTSTSAYMEKAIKYKPRLGDKGLGDHVVKFRAHDGKLYEKASGKLVTDKTIIEAQEKELDKEKYEYKYTEEVAVTMHILQEASQLQANYKPTAYTIYKSAKTGEKVEFDARIKHLDPTGDLTELKKANAVVTYTIPPVLAPIIPDTIGKDSIGLDSIIRSPIRPVATTEAKIEGSFELKEDKFSYTSTDGFEGTQVINYLMVQKDNPAILDTVRVIITVDNEANHPASRTFAKGDYYSLMSSTFSKNEAKVNVLNYVYDLDGDKLNFEITERPSADHAILQMSSNLNPFVTPAKTVHIYSRVFMYVGFFCFGATIVLLILSPFLKRWMHGA